LEENLIEFTKKFFKYQELSRSSSYGCAFSVNDVLTFLTPTCDKGKKDIMSIFPYEDRLEIAKMYLEKVVKHHINGGYMYGTRSYANSYDSEKVLKEIVSTDGYRCNVDVKNFDEITKEFEYNTNVENFHQIYLNCLYEYWDNHIDNQLDKQKAVEYLFERQLTGAWFYYNKLKQNFLKVYLEFLKSRGYKVNIFEIFKNKIYELSDKIEKGTTHYTREYLFDCLILIFDFYMGVIDVYGEDNQKVINKLQNTLNHIFMDKLNVEKLGFMSTFMYIKKYIDYEKDSRKQRYYRNLNYFDQEDVVYFWKKVYNENLNPTMKKIFLNALIHTWNKSPIPKVRNSMTLLLQLSTHTYHYNRGFPYENQKIFYRDLISNANSLKKSVKTILFSKVMTEEGGLYIGG